MQSIYKDFSNVVRERKRDFAGPFHKLYGTGFSGLGALFKNSEFLTSLMGGGVGNSANQNKPSNEVKLNFLD